MLRVSILAIAAVALAACDDESETAAVEGGEADVAVVEEETAAEPEIADEETGMAEAEPEIAAEPEAETEAEAAEETEAGSALAAGEEAGDQPAAETGSETAAAGEAGGEGEEGDTAVLTSESPAVETEIITEEDVQEVEVTEGEATTGEQASMTREGDASEAMQSYQDWAVGRWAAGGSCETDAVVLEENAMSLPGDVNCEQVQVSSAGEESLAITGMSCEGTEDVDQVEIQVAQTADGLSVSRDGQQTQLTRCQ